MTGMNTPKVILIHGNGGGTGSDNWFPYVKRSLESEGFTVIAKTMPDNVLARESIWLPFLKNELGADENTILVGHSSGAVAAMRFAETNKLYGSVLIGACYTDLGDENEKASGYYDRTWQWDAIKTNQNQIVQFASTDDPYIPIEEARYIHEKLATNYHESTNQGHFGEDKGKVTFPEVVEAVKIMAGTTTSMDS
jgi:predicted alpha/beta hydrolase family esterase